MRNLKVECVRKLEIGQNVIAQCIDSDNCILYSITSDGLLNKRSIVCGDISAVKDLRDQPSADIWSSISEKAHNAHIHAFECLYAHNSLLLAFQQDIMMIDRLTGDYKTIYSHKDPICALSVSPNQDLLAIGDNQHRITIIDTYGGVLAQTNALENDQSVHPRVGVGWGSKETQFFGLDGRRSKESQKDQILLSDDEVNSNIKIETSEQFKLWKKSRERHLTLDWRQDGIYLASLVWLPASDKHVIKIWDKTLTLQYLSEPLVDIQHSIINWTPNNYLVTCIQRHNHMNDISLFEKNGLIHKRVQMPKLLNRSHCCSLAWSADSTILAIVVNKYDFSTDDDLISQPVLLLYTYSNAHFYLKYASNLERGADYNLKWDHVFQNKLHILASPGRYYMVQCDFTISSSRTVVASIDGNRVLITPTDICCVPPPMSGITIELDDLVHRLSISHVSDEPRLSIDTLEGLHIELNDPDANKTDNQSVRVRVDNRKCQNLAAKFESNSSVQMQDEPKLSVCEAISIKGDVAGHESLHVPISLTRCPNNHTIRISQSHSLLIDDQVIDNNCRSYKLTDHYIVYTTDNSLHFYRHNDWTIDKTTLAYSQPIEPRAILVTVDEKECRVVLRAPRGNLEVIHPRLLVLASIIDRLNDKLVIDAIVLARRHRVDLNFIIDYLMHTCNWSSDAFEHKLKEESNLVECADNLLVLLLTDLANIDTMGDRYKSLVEHIHNFNSHEDQDENKLADKKEVVSKKVNIVCDILAKLIPSKLEPYLLCLMKMQPPKLGDSLKYIYDGEQNRATALKFMLYFHDVEELFKAAINTYNTDIALMVADASNKDPKEYLALLDDFNKHNDSTLRKYHMDLYCENYEAAFDHLLQCYNDNSSGVQVSPDEITNLVESQRLYKYALKRMSELNLNNDLYNKILSIYGKYLLGKRYHIDAALALSVAAQKDHSGGDVQLALNCYQIVSDWDYPLHMLSKLPEDIARPYLEKYRIGAKTDGRMNWSLCARQKWQDPLTDDEVDELLARNCFGLLAFHSGDTHDEKTISHLNTLEEELCASIDAGTRDAEKQFNRLKHLLSTAQKRTLDEAHFDDNISEFSTSTLSSAVSSEKDGSSSSLKTRKSSKSKSSSKKSKRVTLKEGSRYEDIALILELQKFLPSILELQSQCNSYLPGCFLYMPYHRYHAIKVKLHEKMDKRFELCKKILDTLWPQIVNTDDEQFSLYKRMERLQVAELEDIDYRIMVRPQFPQSLNMIIL